MSIFSFNFKHPFHLSKLQFLFFSISCTYMVLHANWKNEMTSFGKYLRLHDCGCLTLIKFHVLNGI
jgi:hypothetical protein